MGKKKKNSLETLFYLDLKNAYNVFDKKIELFLFFFSQNQSIVSFSTKSYLTARLMYNDFELGCTNYSKLSIKRTGRLST